MTPSPVRPCVPALYFTNVELDAAERSGGEVERVGGADRHWCRRAAEAPLGRRHRDVISRGHIEHIGAVVIRARLVYCL